MLINSPLVATIEQAEDLLTNLRDSAALLQEAIERDAVARARAKDAAETLDAAEAELVTEAVALADLGDGALKGLARTSKAFQYAVDNLLHTARQTTLAHLYRDTQRLRLEADNARMALDRAQVHFTALRYACDLKAQILKAAIV